MPPETRPVRFSRRGLLHLGALGACGLALPDLLRAEAIPAAGGQLGLPRPKSCIFLFLYGGPSQLDTWDLKPHAPDQIRGEFQPIQTAVPGTMICEHLPRMARLASHYSILRSLHHTNANHSPASGWLLTGASPNTDTDPKLRPGPADPPAIGSLVARVSPSRTGMPAFVQLPAYLYFDPGLHFRGQAAGWLGNSYDPLLICQDPNSPSFRVNEFSLPADVSSQRLLDRRRLLETFDEQRFRSPGTEAMTQFRNRALDLLMGGAKTSAFDLSAEPDRVRDRYGRTMFGQGCLLARRLIESGVRLVTVADCAASGEHQWDTHGKNFSTLKNVLLPRLDQAYSALLEDLLQRGLLDDTVVYLGGEFGRTPRIGASTGSGSEPDGRDHWTRCFSGVLAGGATHSGMVYGKSDRFGAFPTENPLTPQDLAATLFRAMSLDPETIVHTRDNRPMPISTGKPALPVLRDPGPTADVPGRKPREREATMSKTENGFRPLTPVLIQ